LESGAARYFHIGDGSLSQFEGYGEVNIQSDEALDVLNPCLPQNLIVNHLSKTFNCSAVNPWCIAPYIAFSPSNMPLESAFQVRSSPVEKVFGKNSPKPLDKP